MEGEAGECIASPTGGDRREIGLPENQLELLRALKLWPASRSSPWSRAARPLPCRRYTRSRTRCSSSGTPGQQGGAAVGDIVFGKQSPSGRLPVTFPMSLDQVPPFADYSMAGRMYRYSEQTPLYPFGFGLSYTQFKDGALKLSSKKVRRGKGVSAEATVKNVGERASEEVVQLYIRDDAASCRALALGAEGVPACGWRRASRRRCASRSRRR